MFPACDFSVAHFFLTVMNSHQGQSEMVMGGVGLEGVGGNNSILSYWDLALICLLKMVEEKDHKWWKSLYHGLENEMTRAHAITPPSGVRTKSPTEAPHKHSICSRLLKVCSVSHLLCIWWFYSGALWWHVDRSDCRDESFFDSSDRPSVATNP